MAIEDWLRLALAPEVGPVLAHRLLESFGEAGAIFQAPARRLAEVHGLGQQRLERLMDPAVRQAAQAEAALARALNVSLLSLDDPAYPELLRRLPRPPVMLWVRGRLDPADRLALAIVGPRTPSTYGKLMTANLIGPLVGHGLTIVSGLAGGIDAEAHRGAIDGGGRTLAVLGQGLGTPIFPQLNRTLAERIVLEDRGALVSIFPLETQPARGLFPMRNEVLAGLSLGTLVIEASPTSGALITARHAAAAGRTVMACPGDAVRRNAQGANRLLADGAALVQDVADVLDALGSDLRRELAELNPDGLAGEAASGRKTTVERGHPLDAALAAVLAEQPMPVDLLIERMETAGHEHAQVLERLLMMELEGRLRQLPGRLYALNSGG